MTITYLFKREAKEQFNCSLIDGLPLEDKSNDRLLWESRIMMVSSLAESVNGEFFLQQNAMHSPWSLAKFSFLSDAH